jgi:sugar phosphate isomerase/epimerase
VQFGISTHLFHDQPLGEHHLRQVAESGFGAVELFAARGHFDYDAQPSAARLGDWLQACGLRLHSVHSPIVESLVGNRWGAAYNNASPNQARREQTVREAIATVELARVVPYEFLIVHLGLPDFQMTGPHDNNRDQAKRSVEQIYEATVRSGVRLALEVIPNDLASPASLVSMIEDELELPDIGICLDFGHAFLMGDLVDAIETVSGHLITTHVHDNRGRTDDHLVPFEGRIDWPAALTAIQKIGYEGTLLFELQSAESPRSVLQRAAAVRRRFEEIVYGEWGQMTAEEQPK